MPPPVRPINPGFPVVAPPTPIVPADPDDPVIDPDDPVVDDDDDDNGGAPPTDPPTDVPEATTIGVLAVGFALLAFFFRRRL
ncbi:MAG: PEP-CTERM sorting domain-containing protein [Pseudomonadota bacterium]